jgi:hypothetical protein
MHWDSRHTHISPSYYCYTIKYSFLSVRHSVYK